MQKDNVYQILRGKYFATEDAEERKKIVREILNKMDEEGRAIKSFMISASLPEWINMRDFPIFSWRLKSFINNLDSRIDEEIYINSMNYLKGGIT